jgi:hypothetical protein
MTPEIVNELVEVFKLGMTNEMAIEHTGIAGSTFYDHLKNNDDFRRKIYMAKDYVRLKAASIVTDAISHNDIMSAKWWLSHKCSEEFGRQQPIKGVFVNNQGSKIDSIGQLVDRLAEEERIGVEDEL